MRKYVALLGYEFKNMLRDPLNIFFLFYPLILLGFAGWVVPRILEQTGLAEENPMYGLQLLAFFAIILAIGGYMMGALLGFLLLENKDEQTIKSIAVTPITVRGYALFKIGYAFFFGFASNLLILFGLKLWVPEVYSFDYNGISFGLARVSDLNIILFSFVSSLVIPTIGGMFAAIAKNKIEGYALMKTSGILFVVPVLSIFDAFMDWKQYLLGFAPNFWPTKAFLTLALDVQQSADLPYWGYLVIGTIYMIGLGTLSISFYLKRSGAERT